MQRPLLRFIGPLIMFIVLWGCSSEVERTSWDTELLFPVLRTSVTIQDIAGEEYVRQESDSTLSLVFQNNLYTFSVEDDIVQVPDTGLKFSLTLDSLVLARQSIVRTITMGQLANQMLQSSDLATQLIGAAIINLHGNPSANVPAFGGIGSGNIDVDATNLFQVASITSGYLKVKIVNGTPLDLNNLVFELKNKSDGSLVLRDTVATVPAGGTVVDSTDMSGKTVEGQLVVKLVNAESPGANGIAVDTADAIIMRITAIDLQIDDALAIFPAQDVININSQAVYDFKGPEITFFKIKEGKLRVDLISTIEDTMKFRFKLPSALYPNGDSVILTNVLPPATAFAPSTYSQDFDVSGISVDLTGKDGNTFNTFPQILKGRIDSTGRLVHLALDDSVSVTYSLVDVVPEYVTGYFGQDSRSVGPETVSLDVFKNIKSGSIDLDQVLVSLDIKNELGVEGEFLVQNLSASRNGTVIPFTSNLIGNPLYLSRAIDNPLTPAYSTYILDNSNSNAVDVIELLPDAFTYEVDLDLNPNGNQWGYSDFAYSNSTLDVNLDIEMPLCFIANDLTLVDTVDFQIDIPQDTRDVINGGELNVIAYNGFPLEADLQLYLYDKNFNFVDSLLLDNTVEAGPLNADCRVIEPLRTKLTTPVDQERLELLENVETAILVASFSTASDIPTCDGKLLKIYSEYDLEVVLTLRFNLFIDGEF